MNFAGPPAAPPAIPNLVVIKLGVGGANAGKVKIFNGSAAQIDVIVDVSGYYG